jgi:hypothetical protein
MNILCNWLGHRFEHAAEGHIVNVKVCHGNSWTLLREYDGLRVAKMCARCSYEHSDTFEVKTITPS